MISPFNCSREDLGRLLAVARGDSPADIVLTNGVLANVLSGEFYAAEVALSGGRIAGVSATHGSYDGREVIDLEGEYIAPGFMDAHVHIESSLLPPGTFAGEVLPHGTTSVISDPHEIANVCGAEGVRYMLAASEGLNLRVFVMLPSCVPATDMETSGARLGPEDIAGLVGQPRVLGIAEVMNYPGLIAADGGVLGKVQLGHSARLRVDGHAPGVGGRALQAYAAAGVASDHESVSAAEALEKLRAGIHVLIRQGSTAQNLLALLEMVTPANSRFCSFSTDDKQPEDLLSEGHIDHNVRLAISAGLDPMLALQMASVNTARHYGLNDIGAIAPGYMADIITFRDLYDLRVTRTFASGRLVAREGELLVPQPSRAAFPAYSGRIAPIAPEQLTITASGPRARVIEVVPDQIVTGAGLEPVSSRGGLLASDPSRDILKIAVIERHGKNGNIGVGLVRGFQLGAGALASSVAHDSHNVVTVGVTDGDMALATNRVLEMHGGLCCVENGQVKAELALPIAGLMSDRPAGDVRDALRGLLEAARSLGCALNNPYMQMAFLALPVIPSLKITDRGLVDVDAFALVDLFV
jgi:adenine deaminase